MTHPTPDDLAAACETILIHKAWTSRNKLHPSEMAKGAYDLADYLDSLLPAIRAVRERKAEWDAMTKAAESANLMYNQKFDEWRELPTADSEAARIAAMRESFRLEYLPARASSSYTSAAIALAAAVCGEERTGTAIAASVEKEKEC
jgi:hypothetical protein